MCLQLQNKAKQDAQQDAVGQTTRRTPQTTQKKKTETHWRVRFGERISQNTLFVEPLSFTAQGGSLPLIGPICHSVSRSAFVHIEETQGRTRHSGTDRSTEYAFREAHRQGGWKGRPKDMDKQRKRHTHERTDVTRTSVDRRHPVGDLRFDTWASRAI